MSSLKDMQGRNCVFQLKVGDDYFNVLCAKTWSLNVNTKMKETTTVGSGFWQEFRPQKLSYTLSFNAVVMIAGDNGEPTVKDLLQNQFNFVPCNYRIICEDSSGALLVFLGQAYVTSLAIDSNPINLLNSTTQFQGNGPIEIDDKVPEYTELAVTVISLGPTGKFRLILSKEGGEIVYDSALLPETQPFDGWLVTGANVIAKVEKGFYYYTIQWEEVTSDGNTFEISGPPPAPDTQTFDHGSAIINRPFIFLDITEERLATFTLGEPYVPPPCIPVSIIGTPSLPNGEVGYYSYSFPIEGSAPFGLIINNRPSWMEIEIVNSLVFFTGIAPEAADNIEVDVTISNCSDSTINFSDSFTINEPTSGWATLTKIGNSLGNICSQPTITVYRKPPAVGIETGVQVFIDEAMEFPVATNYIVGTGLEKMIYSMNPEGFVGTATGNECI